MAMVSIEGVSKVFPASGGGAGTRALEEINLTVADHEFFCLLGPTGCGKSTLLSLIAGFDHITTGRLRLGDQDIVKPGPDRGVVFQEHALFPWLSVMNNVMFGPRSQGKDSPETRERALEILSQVGLKGFENHYPSQLSGGMRQRVAIARVLLNQPQVLLMDEPFGALDAFTRRAMQDLLLSVWTKLRCTVFFVTHDVDEAIFLGDRVGVMSARPGQLKLVETVPLERPRHPGMLTSTEFASTKRRCLDALYHEMHSTRLAVTANN